MPNIQFWRQILCAAAGLVVIAGAPMTRADYVAVALYPLQPPVGFIGVDLNDGAGQQVVGSAFAAPGMGDRHALMLSRFGIPIDLNPASFAESQARATDGQYQVGDGGGFQFGSHALLWHGSAGSVVDLNPSFLDGSEAFGVGGGQQVGVGGAPGVASPPHAILWSGTAASAVDLNPAGMMWSQANGTNGTQQVGHGTAPGTQDAQGHQHWHALLWSGSAASAVDLNPTNLPGITDSSANATNGRQQVGQGNPAFAGVQPGYPHALLWTGTAASAVDLNPSGFESSIALGLNDSQQVGYAETANGSHAMVWSGTAGSALDLQTHLPARFDASGAYTIDAAGNIFGVAYGASGDYSVEWLPHPVLPGDADLNGAVDFADLLALAQHYGQSGGWVNGDFNQDGTVNFGDLLMLAQNYGESESGSAVAGVPEPTCLAIFAFAATLARRRR